MPALPATFSPPPILMYHRVDRERPTDAVGRDLTVSPAQFEAQLRTLRAHGVSAISMHELARRLRAGEPLDHVVVLTFDDGYADQYTQAVPLLRKYGANATFYIISGQVGRPRHVTWPELQAMQRAGFDIAAHGVQHDDLSEMSALQQEAQIRGSVAALRAHVAAPIDTYAYPSGRFNAQTLRIVRANGMDLAVTTDQVYVLPPENRFEITRVRVRSEWDAALFWSAIQAARQEPHIVQSQ